MTRRQSTSPSQKATGRIRLSGTAGISSALLRLTGPTRAIEPALGSFEGIYRAANLAGQPHQQLQAQVIEAFEQIARETGLLVVGDFDPIWNDQYSWLDEDRPGERLARTVSADLTRLPLWEVLETLTDEERLLGWEVSKGRLLLRSPRIQHVMLDRIDLLDDRPPRKPFFPSPDDPKWRHRLVPHAPSSD